MKNAVDKWYIQTVTEIWLHNILVQSTDMHVGYAGRSRFSATPRPRGYGFCLLFVASRNSFHSNNLAKATD